MTPLTLHLKPCPFCGSEDLDVGVQSADSFGVKCRNCHSAVIRWTPNKWPRGVWDKKASADDNMRRLHAYTLKLAAEAWNKRVAEAPEATVTARITGRQLWHH